MEDEQIEQVATDDAGVDEPACQEEPLMNLPVVVGPATKKQEVAKAAAVVDPTLLKPGCINDKNMLVRLYAAGLTHEEIAAFFGTSRTAVTKMIGRMDLTREVANPAIFQEKMQEEILIKMESILGYMSPEKMNKASLSQLIMAFGTLYDKMRLHRGESTSNVASLNVHKLADGDLEKIRDIIKKHTASKLEKVKKEYEVVEAN